ncbi:MAG: amino acid permease [Gaiellaceae bacterium]
MAERNVAHAATRLARKLGTTDAVVIGLGSMIGRRVRRLRPRSESRRVGSSLGSEGLGVAAVVAYANATSSAQLAALYPESGGTYVYGRERLGRFWGFLAGSGFVVGKTASCAAMALTFGSTQRLQSRGLSRSRRSSFSWRSTTSG